MTSQGMKALRSCLTFSVLVNQDAMSCMISFEMFRYIRVMTSHLHNYQRMHIQMF